MSIEVDVSEKKIANALDSEISYEEIARHSDNYSQWGFDAEEYAFENGLSGESFTGYEDYEGDLKRYNSSDFHNSTPEKQQEIINYVADIYEEVGIFPIRYYTDFGAQEEILRCFNFDAKFKGNVISTGLSVGTMLCSWQFPNLWKTPSAQDMTKDKAGGETAWKKFYNRKFLEKVVSFCYNYNSVGPKGFPGVNPLSGIRMIGSVPTNFRPMNAQAIYERFIEIPKGGTIFDFSSGFGGRMLGALTSNRGFTYIGTDPETETMYNLHKMGHRITDALEGMNLADGTELTDKARYELHCCGSEEIDLPKESIDFAFSSPPYFDLELYGSDGGDFNSENQSFNKYPELDDWMNHYVRGTIRNIVKGLKHGATYAVNIADFKLGSRDVQYVSRWKEISEEEGAPHYDTFYLGVRARSGSKLLGNKMAGNSLKTENIMLFKKK